MDVVNAYEARGENVNDYFKHTPYESMTERIKKFSGMPAYMMMVINTTKAELTPENLEFYNQIEN